MKKGIDRDYTAEEKETYRMNHRAKKLAIKDFYKGVYRPKETIDAQLDNTQSIYDWLDLYNRKAKYTHTPLERGAYRIIKQGIKAQLKH